jgi:ethanolamine permease
LGIKEAAWFSLVMTMLALVELLVFFGITAPHFRSENFLYQPLPFGIKGIFAALPFAIWLYVCLEGVAMVAEEVKGGKRTIAKGYISALLTLAVLAFGVMLCVGGIAHWDRLSNLDYPLPESIALVLGRDSKWTQLFTCIGLFGLIASFHGIIISYSRQLFALARAGYLPPLFSVVGKKRGVPYVALLAGSVFGLVAIFFLNTGDLVVLSTIGAVVLYLVSMFSLFRLRQQDPGMERPYKAPLYPVFPVVAVVISMVALAAMVYLYTKLSALFLGGLVVVFVLLFARKGIKSV